MNFNHLAQECDAIITEAVYNHRQTLLEGYHLMGKAIVEAGYEENYEGIAKMIRQRPKTVRHAILLYKKYPDLDQLPMGKTISWYKITKMLDEEDGNKA